MTSSGNHIRQRFDLADAIALLRQTPATLDALLRDLPDVWIEAHEGGDSWNPFDIVGHLIHADRTNWIPRARVIVEHGDTKPFDDFDRVAQLTLTKGRTMSALLDEFAAIRQESLHELSTLGRGDLERRGRHPALGGVSLRQLLSTWVVHDLDHVMQITRVLARQYSDEVGPWRGYLRILREPGD